MVAKKEEKPGFKFVEIDMSKGKDHVIKQFTDNGMPLEVAEMMYQSVLNRGECMFGESNYKPDMAVGKDNVAKKETIVTGTARAQYIHKTQKAMCDKLSGKKVDDQKKKEKKPTKPQRFDMLGGVVSPIVANVVKGNRLSDLLIAIDDYNCRTKEERDSTTNHVGYLAAVKGPKGRIHIGITFCIPSDHNCFDSEYGRDLAKARAIRMMDTELEKDNLPPVSQLKTVLIGRTNRTTRETCSLFMSFIRSKRSMFFRENCGVAYMLQYPLQKQLNRFITRCEKYFKTSDWSGDVCLMQEHYAHEVMDANPPKK